MCRSGHPTLQVPGQGAGPPVGNVAGTVSLPALQTSTLLCVSHSGREAAKKPSGDLKSKQSSSTEVYFSNKSPSVGFKAQLLWLQSLISHQVLNSEVI